MHRLMDRITPLATKSYTHLKEFRNVDMEQNLITELSERMKLLEIPELVTFDGIKPTFKKLVNDSIDDFTHNIQLEVSWKILNKDTGEFESISFVLNIPELYNGTRLLIGGREYFVLLSFATRGHVHSTDKVIFKLKEEMQLLYLSGVPSFDVNGKRVNMFSVLLLSYLNSGKTLSALLSDTVTGSDIIGHDDPRMKTHNVVKFKDFAILLPKYPRKSQQPFVKSLSRLKTYTVEDCKDPEKLARKIRGSFGSPTSKKSTMLINDLLAFIDAVTVEKLLANVDQNVKKEYTGGQLELTPVYVSTLATGVYATIKKNFKTYQTSHQQTHDKLLRVFNQTVFLNLCANSLFKSKLLQFRDSTSVLTSDLKVSLSHQSGSRVTDASREVTKDYKHMLGLNYVAAGESAGLSSVIAPV